MTELMFQEDAYQRECEATVADHVDGAVVLDRTLFYPLGGGQPGDTSRLTWDEGAMDVVDTRYGDCGSVRHIAADGAALPAVGTTVKLALDWDRRYRHMRMHTALHLLGAVLKFGVTGGNISAAKSRLDFDMTEPVDKEFVNQGLRELIEKNAPVTSRWISDAELDAQPDLVRTLSVKPPKGAGRVRLLDIDGIDLQPCGGTHLRSTGEVGAARVSKVEKKGKRNRRVNIVLDD